MGRMARHICIYSVISTPVFTGSNQLNQKNATVDASPSVEKRFGVQ
jgi:hypothetical protein